MPDDRLPKLFALVILIALHGYFAAAEAALSSLPEARMRRQAEEGDENARRLLKLTEKPECFLSAIQVVCSLATLFSSVLAAESLVPPLAGWLRTLSGPNILSDAALHILLTAAVLLVLSFVSLVLGTLVPQRLAEQKPEAAARVTFGGMRLASALLRPACWLLDKSASGVLRLFRIDPKAGAEELSEDEILMMVDRGEERGAIEAAEKELIENIFEFNNTTAEDVMIHRPDMELLWVDDTAEDVLSAIRETGLSRFPVYGEDADDILGILNTRDYLLNTQLEQPQPLRELIRPAYFVPESVRTDALFRDMQNRKVHIAIVVDEYGGTSGLVTMEDLLEEIVGNIYDEFDPQEAQEILPVGENLWRVAGATELETLEEELEIKLPEDEEYDTLGGLVFSQLSVIPEDGSQFEVDVPGLHIMVEDFSDRRVEWALVSKTAPEVPEEPENG